MSITSSAALKKFGAPGNAATQGKYMKVWVVPADIRAAFSHVFFSALGQKGFPAKIFCNTLLIAPLEKALRNLIARGKASEMKTWDGCYIVRNARGLSSWSLHAWGLAIDVNAATNQLGKKPTLSAAFVKCFTDAGFEWGGPWSRPDGMHFQLKALP
jgi:hypothetical protein